MRRLPPFPELVAFEAVARQLSFTRAGTELCLTQSAVSHRVRRLERHLGARLLHRLNPGVALTSEGQALLCELAGILDALGRLGTRGRRTLRIAAGSALCGWWLAGRLGEFLNAHPGLSVDLVPVETGDSPPPGVDVRILWVAPGEDAATSTQSPLFHERVFPVCSPRLLPGGRPLSNAVALGQMTLLHKGAVSIGEWSWPLWLDRLGVTPAARAGSEMRFAEMGLVLAAAVDGAGVALARSLLVADTIRAGRLVVAIANVTPMTSSKRHVARWSSARNDDPDVLSFVHWITDQAARTLSEPVESLPSGGMDVPQIRPRSLRAVGL